MTRSHPNGGEIPAIMPWKWLTTVLIVMSTVSFLVAAQFVVIDDNIDTSCVMRANRTSGSWVDREWVRSAMTRDTQCGGQVGVVAGGVIPGRDGKAHRMDSDSVVTYDPVSDEVSIFQSIGGRTMEFYVTEAQSVRITNGMPVEMLATTVSSRTPYGGTVSMHGRVAGVAAHGQVGGDGSLFFAVSVSMDRDSVTILRDTTVHAKIRVGGVRAISMLLDGVRGHR